MFFLDEWATSNGENGFLFFADQAVARTYIEKRDNQIVKRKKYKDYFFWPDSKWEQEWIVPEDSHHGFYFTPTFFVDDPQEYWRSINGRCWCWSVGCILCYFFDTSCCFSRNKLLRNAPEVQMVVTQVPLTLHMSRDPPQIHIHNSHFHIHNAQAKQQDKALFQIGHGVTTVGLLERTQDNGKSGVVIGVEAGLVQVAIEDMDVFTMNPANLIHKDNVIVMVIRCLSLSTQLLLFSCALCLSVLDSD